MQFLVRIMEELLKSYFVANIWQIVNRVKLREWRFLFCL